MIGTLLKKYENFTPFTDDEAWGLFRMAAIAEAVGWSLLIFGILFARYITPGNDMAVQITGRVHGILFLTYIAAVIVLYPSQHWTRGRTIIAGIASAPPYGSLIFEQWIAHKRRRTNLSQTVFLSTYHGLMKLQENILAV